MTLPTGRRLDFVITVAKTRKIEGKAGHQSVFEALKKSCPHFFPRLPALSVVAMEEWFQLIWILRNKTVNFWKMLMAVIYGG